MPPPEAEKYIPRIEPPSLPATLPSAQALQSSKQNPTSYEPDLWGLQYAIYRYLERMPEDKLRARHDVLLRNLPVYGNPERDVIPLQNYQSSWYWHRKLYQTRLEFAYRSLDVPPPAVIAHRPRSTFNLRAIPNGTDVLFRYGKQTHLLDLAQNGRLRIVPASTYEGAEHNVARRDEEMRKQVVMAGKHTTITTADGKSIPILGDVTKTVSGSQYHLVCFSTEWNDALFDDFEADACAVVVDPEAFTSRLAAASRNTFPGWYFHHNPVSYFDPHEMGRNEYLDSAMSKDFSYAYQNEYRILWSQLAAGPVTGFQFIEMGDARDLVQVFDRAGRRLGI